MNVFLIIVVIAIFLLVMYVLSSNTTAPTSNRIETSLLNWLEIADESYIRTFQQKDVRYFEPYTTLEVSTEIYDEIMQKPERLFGTRRYRTRVWDVISKNNNDVVVKKTLTHSHIELQGGIKVPLGDNLCEMWYVTYSNNAYKVKKIEELKYSAK